MIHQNMLKSEQIFEYINSVRKEQKMSKSELAKQIGCSSRVINYWEKGERRISIDMADKALKVLGVSYVLGVEGTVGEIE